MPILQTPYDRETDDMPVNGILLEADSLEEAQWQLAELPEFENLILLYTDDPEVSA